MDIPVKIEIQVKDVMEEDIYYYSTLVMLSDDRKSIDFLWGLLIT